MLNIKNLFWSFVEKYFKTNIQNEINKAINNEREDKRNHYNEIKTIELSQFIGKPVICISNEWADPIIGFGLRVEFITRSKNPILCTHNYLDGREYLIMGAAYHFTEQRFDALFKINRFELCSFIYNHASSEPFEKIKSCHVREKEEIKQLLEVNGFYKCMEDNAQQYIENRSPRDAAHQDAVNLKT